MERKTFIETYIDLDSIPKTMDDTPVPVPEELVKDAMTSRVIEEKYWYFNEAGADSYVRLNSSGDKYKTFNASKNIIKTYVSDILQITLDTFQLWEGSSKETPPKMDIISLGFGGAEKEIELLSVFLDEYTHDNNPLTFIPVDLSYPLLMRGMRETYKFHEQKIFNKTLIIKPCLTDFTKTTSKDFGDSECVLITALGIVYNASIPNIFDSFKDIMTEKSLLLMDVEMIGGRTDDELCESYNDEFVKKFFFSPIELLNKLSKYNKSIFKNGRRIGNCKDFEGLDFDSNKINAEIISSDNMNNFIKKHKLSSESKNKIRISPDSKSKTVAIVYTPKEKPAYVLGYSTRFDESSFSDMLDDHGFSILKQYTKANSNTVYFLLELKQPGSSPNNTNIETPQSGKSIVN